MNYGVAEQEIVERLNSFIASIGKLDKYEAALLPENEEQFKTFYSNFTKARAAVQYIDSIYNPNKSTGIALQDEKARFRLTFEARKLRGEGGLYNLMEIVKLSLLGFRLSNSDRLTIAKYGLLEFEQNGLQPYLEFECMTLNAQLHDDNTEQAIGGNFKTLGQRNFNDANFSDEFQETQ